MTPGCIHDAKVFANLTLNHRMRSGRFPQTFNMLSHECHKVPNYVIGDPAYPLAPYCMKEFKSCTTNAQVLFNKLLHSACKQIECAFGRLKAWWSILTRKIDFNTEMVPTVIYAALFSTTFASLVVAALTRKQLKHRCVGTKQRKVSTKTFLTLFTLAQVVNVLWLETHSPHVLVKLSATSDRNNVRCILHISNHNIPLLIK